MVFVETDKNDNKIFGYKPDLINSNIVFNGKNNRVICEEDVKLYNSKLKFNGDNSIIYLSSTKNRYHLGITMYNNSVLFIDENASMNGRLNIILSEEQNMIIGKDCLFSWGIWFRVADPHLIYDVVDKNRINLSKGIFLGDHVWVGQDAMILKGTHIGSGSIIGAKSLVSHKKIPSNTIWGGNPAKQIKEGVFFNKASANVFTKDQTKQYMKWDEEDWIFFNEGQVLNFSDIDKKLSETSDLDEKVALIKNIRDNNSHNRFYIGDKKK